MAVAVDEADFQGLLKSTLEIAIIQTALAGSRHDKGSSSIESKMRGGWEKRPCEKGTGVCDGSHARGPATMIQGMYIVMILKRKKKITEISHFRVIRQAGPQHSTAQHSTAHHVFPWNIKARDKRCRHDVRPVRSSCTLRGGTDTDRHSHFRQVCSSSRVGTMQT